MARKAEKALSKSNATGVFSQEILNNVHDTQRHVTNTTTTNSRISVLCCCCCCSFVSASLAPLSIVQRSLQYWIFAGPSRHCREDLSSTAYFFALTIDSERREAAAALSCSVNADWREKQKNITWIITHIVDKRKSEGVTTKQNKGQRKPKGKNKTKTQKEESREETGQKVGEISTKKKKGKKYISEMKKLIDSEKKRKKHAFA